MAYYPQSRRHLVVRHIFSYDVITFFVMEIVQNNEIRCHTWDEIQSDSVSVGYKKSESWLVKSHATLINSEFWLLNSY